jgi:tetratricopeptide (TPR) repeat protein
LHGKLAIATAGERALGNLGIAYLSLGEYAQAIDYLQQSLTIFREIDHRNGEGLALTNLGNAYNCLGDYSQRLSIATRL